jgi:drug/metabolite transporter (DMT)-like permease
MRANKPLMAMMLSMVAWGVGNPFSDYSIDGLSPYATFFAEMVTGFVLFFAIAIFSPAVRNSIRHVPWKLAIPFGLIQPGLAYLCGNIGFQYGSVTTGAILMSSEVIFLALGGAVILREKLSLSSILALAVGISGAVIVGIAGAANNSETAGLRVDILGFSVPAGLVGAVAFLGVGLSGAVYGLFTRRLSPEINVMSLTLGQVATAVVMSSFTLIITRTPVPNPTENGLYFWAAVMGGLLGTTLPFFLFNYAAPQLTTKQTAITLNIIPVVAIFSGAILGRGLPVGKQYLGIVLVLISLFALETKAEEKS